MWTFFSHAIIKYRVVLLIVIGALTAWMGYHARQVELGYDFAKFVPNDDPDMVYFKAFKTEFGEDANLIALGLKDKSIYTSKNLQKLKYLTDELSKLEGVREVLSLTKAQNIFRNDEKERFDIQPLFQSIPEDQSQTDSLLRIVKNLKFYHGQVINPENGATLVLIFIKKEFLHTLVRDVLVDDVRMLGEAFTKDTGIQLYYTGLPYIGALLAAKVKSEMKLFLGLSLLITVLALLAFFRSWKAVVFPLIVVMVSVVWVLGSIHLFGYKLTVLSGLIPPIIVVIGIPNCIYLITRYHQEYVNHQNKIKALSTMLRRIGVINLVNNLTTAIGFLVLYSTKVSLLEEFGIAAGVNIIVTYIISLILIPALFTFLPAPRKKQLRHLEFKGVNGLMRFIERVVTRQKPILYVFTTLLVCALVVGLYQVKTVSYMVDDLPKGDRLRKDLAFFEENFKGVMPLEIVIDTGKKKGITSLKYLKKADEFEQFLQEQPGVSAPMSVVTLAKAFTQAYYEGDSAFYRLPTNQERAFIASYLNSDKKGMPDFLKSFTDTLGRKMRISFRVADIGSLKIDSLLNTKIIPQAKNIFDDPKTEVKITGTTLLYSKGNNYLVDNLKESLLLTFVLVSIVIAVLFRSARSVVAIVIPNAIPLLFTAALMGFLNIPLKPSTVLIFGIAFGIAVDYGVHVLARFNHEIKRGKISVNEAVSHAVWNAGPGIFYTSVVLFAGFFIFSFSEFGGTRAMGILTSATLFFAMFVNLMVLPALLISLSGKRPGASNPNKKREKTKKIAGEVHGPTI